MEGLSLLAVLVASQADAGTAAPEPITILVRRLDSNQGSADLVPG